MNRVIKRCSILIILFIFTVNIIGCGQTAQTGPQSKAVASKYEQDEQSKEDASKSSSLTGVYKSEKGSTITLKQEGNIITGTGILGSDSLKRQISLKGAVSNNTVIINATYNDAELLAKMYSIPLAVAKQAVGVSDQYIFEYDVNSRTLIGTYYMAFIDYNPNNNKIISRADGGTQEAKTYMVGFPTKFYSVN